MVRLSSVFPERNRIFSFDYAGYLAQPFYWNSSRELKAVFWSITGYSVDYHVGAQMLKTWDQCVYVKR